MALSEVEELELLELEEEEAKRGSSGRASSGSSGVFNFLRKFVQSATGDLSEPAAAGLSALGEKNTQMLGQFPEGSDRPIGEAYEDYRGQGRESLGRFEAEHPIASGVANLAGLMTPGGAFGKLFGIGTKVAGKAAPFISRLVGTGRAGGRGPRGGPTNPRGGGAHPPPAAGD